jgi:hypothetical protein
MLAWSAFQILSALSSKLIEGPSQVIASLLEET